MTAYNGVNGTYCSENSKLLDKMLRTEWGWNGLVMSDWYGTYSTTSAALAGLDIEMPGPTRFRGEALKFMVGTDNVKQHVLNERVRNVLNLVKKCAASGIPENAPESTADTPRDGRTPPETRSRGHCFAEEREKCAASGQGEEGNVLLRNLLAGNGGSELTIPLLDRYHWA